jgi:hypothetical protein
MHILMSFFCSPSRVLLCSSVDGAPRARIFRGCRLLDEALAEFDTSSAAQLDTFREASVGTGAVSTVAASAWPRTQSAVPP